MPDAWDEETEKLENQEKKLEQQVLEEQEALEEQAQAEREEKLFKAVRGCNILLVVAVTIIIALILLYVNFYL